ncbi:MAG: nucleotide sugar dehydrogenase [Desulfovibrio sp.]|nr:nucleotide sugar dehydrogenase [Desulfovibrio sp.]
MLHFDDLTAGRERIAVIGLGYVGLPLAVALAGHFPVIGFDISSARIQGLQGGHDRTGEVEDAALAAASITFSCRDEDLTSARLLIVAVPTPIDLHRNPDLSPIQKASALVGKRLTQGAVVVYESTVYPGVTEDICVPILEQTSGLVFARDFTVGYSPERINPGDKTHTVENIVKVVSGSTPQTLELLADVYGSIIAAGVHRASSIKVAEAAKVIENTQRDLNIALMNELALIFDRLGIDTFEVLEAAGTKWNFLPFRPGLVGGHCIGVDPYYLTYKAQEVGYHPEVILAGRRINDGMGKYIAEKTVKMLIRAGSRVNGARVGIFGLTFKENVPDLRNTRVVDIRNELEEYGIRVLVHDPLADAGEAMEEYGLALTSFDNMRDLDAAVFAVSHKDYVALDSIELRSHFAHPDKAIILDIKGIWEKKQIISAGYSYWRL